MTQVTFNLPSTLATLPLAERDSLIRAGLFEAVQLRIRHLAVEIKESEQHVQSFEGSYDMSLAQFEADQLPTLNTPQAHEEYNDWFFWTEALHQQQQIMAELQRTVFD